MDSDQAACILRNLHCIWAETDSQSVNVPHLEATCYKMIFQINAAAIKDRKWNKCVYYIVIVRPWWEKKSGQIVGG